MIKHFYDFWHFTFAQMQGKFVGADKSLQN